MRRKTLEIWVSPGFSFVVIMGCSQHFAYWHYRGRGGSGRNPKGRERSIKK